MNKLHVIGVAFAVIVIGWLAWPEVIQDNEKKSSGIDVSRAMSEDSDGFKRVLAPRAFEFPQDHGPHPDYKTEWWYFTGNLETQSARRFGYQLTIFRIGLTAEKTERSSQWATTEIYMGHFGLTDLENKKFYRFERFSRAALGLSGAQAKPFKVWLESWQLESQGDKFLPISLQVHGENVSIELSLNSTKPIVLQGDKGMSQKSEKKGNASYYYSLTNLQASGVITLNGTPFNVQGSSWLDREWSTSALGEKQAGWDWFALQLSDGRDIMFYRLRRKDGTTDPFSAGSIVSPEGHVTVLKENDVQLTQLKEWRSPESDITYPIHWRMEIPAQGLNLIVEAIQPNQEMLLSAQYWEGAVDVMGTANGTEITGRGYLELAGYSY